MRISGLKTNGLLRAVRIERHEGEHTSATLEYILPKSDVAAQESIMRQLCDQVGAELEIVGDVAGREKRMLRGIAARVTGHAGFRRASAEVHVVSLSERTDGEQFERVYQDTKKTIGAIVSAVQPSGASAQITDQELAQAHVPGMVAQQNETDFAFLRRIAHDTGRPFFVVDTDATPRLCIGALDRRGPAVDEAEVLDLSFERSDTTALLIRSRQELDFGSIARLAGRQYLVTDSVLTWEDHEIVWEYVLRSEAKIKPDVSEIEVPFLWTGAALVRNARDPDHLGRLQLEFTEIEDRLPGERAWNTYLPLLTEKDGGQVLLPDPDETVETVISRGRCVVVGCVRETALRASLQDPACRAWSFRDQEMVLTGDALKGTIFGLSIAADNRSAELSRSSSSARLEDDSIRLEMGREIAAKAKEIRMEDAVSLKGRISIEDTISIKGKISIEDTVSLKGKISMDGAIKAKTSTFEII